MSDVRDTYYIYMQAQEERDEGTHAEEKKNSGIGLEKNCRLRLWR